VGIKNPRKMFTKKAKELLKALIERNAEDISREYNQSGLSWEERRLLKKSVEDAKKKEEENKRPRT
jgi:hypothetical protein